MNYLEFYQQWRPHGCFNVQQVYAWRPDFDRHNLRNWVGKERLVKLRKEFYAFAECRAVADFDRYVANRIYRPSYVSLHTALAAYGMIPEAVVQITSVTTLKTASFANAFGQYAYHTVKPELMFGFEPKPMVDGRVILFALPEKALLDLLYLNPYYRTDADMLDLRLDPDYMADDFNPELFLEFARRAGQQSTILRAQTLLNAYEI